MYVIINLFFYTTSNHSAYLRWQSTILGEHLYRCSPNTTVKAYSFLFNCVNCYENFPSFKECVPVLIKAHYCSKTRNLGKPEIL